LSAYAYTDGSAVTSADTSLYYNGSTVSTTYTSVGGGWYQLTGTVTGVASSVTAGVQVASGKTVYIDNVSLNSYATPGTLTSSIFDSGQGSNWGTLTYSATTPTNTTVSVKVRTSNDSGMSGATAFSSCTAISSGVDMSANSCVTDSHRYVQYHVTLATTDTSVTATFSDVSIPFEVSDADVPSVSLTPLSPDPNTDSTPAISGTVTESIGTVASVQFQMDATSGSWTACTADDGSFDEASEAFTCSVTLALTDGSHTIYIRSTDSNGNTTASGSEATDTFTIDTTAPASIDLDSPGHNSYTNNERPSFRWKATTDATAGLSKYVLEVNNPSTGDDQPSGDFTIDNIPTSGTTDITSNNKYVVHFDGFSDSDSTNNYISIYTRSTSDWGASENDGKLREGIVGWKVKAIDSAGNEISSSRTLFVDRTNPTIEFTQVNDIPFSNSSDQTFSTTDKTPTVFGRITDPLSGADNNGQTKQDENGPKVAAGPQNVTIKVEKRTGLLYTLVNLYTINMNKPWYTCDNMEVLDNSKQKCDKYLPFEYTPDKPLELGTYKITLTGTDKAGNSPSETVLTLNITTLAQIITPEENQVIDEETEILTPDEKQELIKELEITKPTEEVPTTDLQQIGDSLSKTGESLVSQIGNMFTTLLRGIGNGIQYVFNTTGNIIAFMLDTTGDLLAFIFDQTGQWLAFVGNGIGNYLEFMSNSIATGYNFLAHMTTGATKTFLLAFGNGVDNVGKFIVTIAHNIAREMSSAMTASQNGITNLAFGIGEKTQDVSDTVGLAIIKFTYNFVSEPTTIYAVKVKTLSPTSARISWQTNHPANGKVNYGLDRTYPFDVQSEKRVTHHEFTLKNLKPDTVYHFEVMSHNKNYVYDANREFRTPKAQK